MSDQRDPSRITSLLAAAQRREPGAQDRLFALVYEELRGLASGHMAREGEGHSLHATALVHEAFLRLEGGVSGRGFENRAHFFGAAGEAMRRILVDHARARHRLKRGGARRRLDLGAVDVATDTDPASVLALDEALSDLQGFDPRLAEVVKLRCFVGLTIAETAEALGVAARTVDRDWTVARAWLKARLGDVADEDPGTHGGGEGGVVERA